ncbi:hypothetical protein SDJN03_24265, partial [Cucurbita argyrosperma subsp. sororia]
MIETALAVRFSGGANFCYSSALSNHRPAWTSEDVTCIGHVNSSCRLFQSCASDVQWKRCQRLNSRSLLGKNNLKKNGIQASAEHLGSASDPIKQNRRLQYHPSEEFVKSITEIAEDVRPTSAETTRTIIEVNGKATLMFAGLINDEVQENIIWPDLPYVTDEHGNIYFQVKSTEETLQNLNSENNFVSASDDPIDCMEEPPATLLIQGFLRPAFSEEHTVIQRHLSSRHSSNGDIHEAQKLEDNLENRGRINHQGHESSSSKDGLNMVDGLAENIPVNDASFYRLEMIKVQLCTGHAHPSNVEIEDLMKAQPDAIGHSAEKIISRLRAGGEKTTQALKSLCWRCKGIQVEEAVINGIDSLGFDVRVCSGTQVQTLRFAFDTRATSEFSAEKQLDDLLFPRIHSKPPKMKQTHQNEC